MNSTAPKHRIVVGGGGGGAGGLELTLDTLSRLIARRTEPHVKPH